MKFDATIHDRSIVANSGWRMNLGRGLDIFQYVASDAFDLAAKLQQYRQVKAFGVTYILGPRAMGRGLRRADHKTEGHELPRLG